MGLVSRYHRLPEGVRMVLTAVLGAAIGYVTYSVVYWLDPLEPRAATAWAISFLVGVSRQHGLHRWLTFTHDTPYWPSLGRAYAMYGGSLVVGTALDWLLTRAGVDHRVAWLLCLCVTTAVSLVLLRSFVFPRSTGGVP